MALAMVCPARFPLGAIVHAGRNTDGWEQARHLELFLFNTVFERMLFSVVRY